MFEKKILLEVGVTDANQSQILEYILQTLGKKSEKYYIVTPNPEILVFAAKHKSFKEILNNARLALCDGTGVLMASRFLGKSLSHRVTGVDLMEKLCFAVSKRPITVGFLGGGPRVAERTADCLVSSYPGLNVAYVGEEWGQDGFVLASQHRTSQNRAQKNTEKVQIGSVSSVQRGSAVDILFVAFGFPKQEEWMASNIDNIPVKVAIGVGGAFDYISGRVNRAPKIVQRGGFEWLYRLLRQPWRIKRQLALLEFIFLILKEKFKK